MIYTSLAVKILTSAFVAASLLFAPLMVNSITMDKPYEKTVEVTPPVVVVKKPIVKKAIVKAPKGDCTKYASIIEGYDWPISIAMQICAAESSGNQVADNPEAHRSRSGKIICYGSWGLFQIACVHGHAEEEMKEAVKNIGAAYKIWDNEGWAPWTTYKKIIK